MEEDSLSITKYLWDAAKLQAVFPEEIWLLIFNKIFGSKHYHFIDAASPYFHKLLLPLRTRILFPEVIKHYFKRQEGYNISPKAAISSLFKYRAVCRAWKHGVEALFHQMLSETNPNPTDWKRFCQDRLDFGLNPHQRSLIFRSSEDRNMDKFLEFFHNSHFLTGSNPFPSRSIHIRISSMFVGYETLNIYYNNLVDVLRIYGEHIWHFYVRLWCQERNKVQQCMLILQSMLKLLQELQTLRILLFTDVKMEYFEKFLIANPLPELEKLKVLEVESDIAGLILSHLIQTSPPITKLKIANQHSTDESTWCLQNTFRKKPFLKLEKLEILEEHNVAKPVFSPLIETNPHITKLRIDELDLNKHSAIFTTPLPNLNELHIVRFANAESLLQLQNVPFEWPLKILTLFCHSDIPHVDSVFNLLETRWAGSLKELKLIIPAQTPFFDPSPLRLPHIHTLRIKTGRYIDMDFILLLSESLVSLSVYHDGTKQYEDFLEKNSAIQLFLHRKNLLKSNIWEYFPELEEIYYADERQPELSVGRFYTRNHYKKYSSKRM